MPPRRANIKTASAVAASTMASMTTLPLSSRRWVRPIVPVPGLCCVDDEDERVGGADVGVRDDGLLTGGTTNPPPLGCDCDVLVDG
jgi:hypothetical protein